MKKNLFTIWWIFLFCLLVLNCKFSVTSAEPKIEVSKMLAFIPDRFNTGCNESELWEIQTGNYGSIIEAGTDCEEPKNAYFEVRDGEKYNDIVINAYSNKSLANVIKISNLKFTRKLMPLNADRIVNEEPLYKSEKTIIFENCKFVNVQHNSKKLKLIFKNCTFTGNVSSANIELENCRIERTQKDAMNPLVNYKAKNVFIRDLLYKVTDSGAHVDGVQIFGNKDVLAQNILIENCRFAIPSFQLPGGNAGVNAALMMQLEYGNADGITFKDIMIDCGGPWSPCRSSKPREIPRGAEEGAPPLWQKNVVFENIHFSNHYKKCFHGDYYTGISEINICPQQNLYVTSVIQDVHENTHIIVSNNSKEDRTLIVKYGVQEWKFKIPHMPQPLEVYKLEKFQNLTYDDLPFDIDCVVPALLNRGQCFDGGIKILDFNFNY